MADWSQVSRGMQRGFQRGAAIGGRGKALGGIIKKVADGLREQRLAGEETGRKKELLGTEEASKMRLLEKEAELKPTTQPVIDPDTGKFLYDRPAGSVFKPIRAESLSGQAFEAIGEEPKPIPKPILRGKIRVKRKSDGQAGTIEENEFDPTLYDKL